MSAERDPGLRERVEALLNPEPLAALLTVGGVIVFLIVLVALIGH